MLKTFLSVWYLSVAVVQFDTQDNLVRTINGNWDTNVNPYTLEPMGEYALWRTDNKRFWVKTKKAAKTIRLNNYPYQYKVKKVSPYHFVVTSIRLQDYFDNTDIIEIIVKH